MSLRSPFIWVSAALLVAVVPFFLPWGGDSAIESTDGPHDSNRLEADVDASGSAFMGTRQLLQDEVNGDPVAQNWNNEPETVAAFLASYNKLIPRSLEATDELRSKQRPKRDSEFAGIVAFCKKDLLFCDLEISDFEGLAYDTQTEARNSLFSQLRELGNWKSMGSRYEDLPHSQSLLSEPNLYPPEFIIYKLAGHTDIVFSDEEVRRVSEARNTLVRELAMIRGMEFELHPAVVWAAREIGVDWTMVPEREVISEWNDIHGLRLREVDTYRNLMYELGTKYQQ